MRKAVVMLDAGFEAILATVLLMGVAYASIDERDFPSPASNLAIGILALALYALAVGLATAVKNEAVTDRLLALLAAGNAAFGLLVGLWAALAHGFSDAGHAVAWVTAVALLALSASQALALGRR